MVNERVVGIINKRVGPMKLTVELEPQGRTTLGDMFHLHFRGEQRKKLTAAEQVRLAELMKEVSNSRELDTYFAYHSIEPGKGALATYRLIDQNK